MLKQSFTADNFRKIFDYENRKGVYLEGRFFPKIKLITQELKDISGKLKELDKNKESYTPDIFKIKNNELESAKQKLKDKKEELLNAALQKVSEDIAEPGFGVALKIVQPPNGKCAYAVDDSPATYFCIKQIQYNIRKLYKVKQGNRREIISQLKIILDDKYPKYIIRTDIDNFYESISQQSLIRKLSREALLTHSSKKIIKQILRQYTLLSQSNKGIPRGVGISAYLSELYIRSFDNAIKEHDEVIYYARYVDDIIIIFAPKPNSSTDQFLEFIRKEAKEIDLNLNPTKTDEFDLSTQKICVVDYLGYEITFGKEKIKFELSQKKKDKYKNRIKLCFDDYKKHSKTNEKQARKLLVKRIRFLTSNTRLMFSKNNILTGIFYSNNFLSDATSLQFLDSTLANNISLLGSEPLKNRLKKFSFKIGFAQKVFTPFTTKELSKITNLWKYET